ncbi:hypothetical protein, partial [Bacteroides caecigallinarum]|uniref:hypothetical protein n=1 Tax=Bacteroides caecigallinarum TaxID=1411144 RepID=UPI0019598C71
NERICSVFYALFKPILAIIVGGLCRSKWVGMLRFRHEKAREMRRLVIKELMDRKKENIVYDFETM